MKRKVLSIILSVVVSLILVGCIASAGYSPDAVVAVNGVELTQAEVSEGKLAQILADCRMGGTIDVVSDFSVSSITLGASADGNAAKWVINGNGHTITDSDNTQRDSTSHTAFLIYISDAVVEINDLTLKTGASGIRVNESYADITLNNVNVYASKTVPGATVTNIPETSASTLKRYAYALYFRGADEKHYGLSLDNISVTVNGGEYKTAGADGCVAYLRGASMVVNGGSFIGEDCTYVVWAYNLYDKNALVDVDTSLTVHDGLFVRPVYNGAAVGASNPDAAVGGVIRVTRGALFNSFGGTYINCDGTMPSDGESAPASYCIVTGLNLGAGIVKIYGGEFYQLSAPGSTTGEVIGHALGTMDTSPETVVERCIATILGGKFYVREGLANSNLAAILDAKADSAITENDGSTIQRAVWSEFSVSKSNTLVTKTAYGKEYTDLVEISFGYTGAKGSYAFSVTNPNGSVYYTNDLALAFNSLAANGATIKVLKKYEITGKTASHISLLNRNMSVTLTSGGATGNQLIFNPNSSYTYDFPYAIFARSGKLTINNKTVIKTRGDQTALYLGLPGDRVYPLRLEVVMNDARFVRGSSLILLDNGCAEGSVSTTSCKSDYVSSSSYNSYSYKSTSTYPTPKPDIKLYTNLTLHGGFDINFYFPLDGNRVTSATICGEATPLSDMQVVELDGVKHYKVTYSGIGPAEAMKSVPFSIAYRSQGGYFTYTAESNYSIVTYSSGVVSDEKQPASANELIRRVMNYVSAAYLYFGNVAEATEAEITAVTDFVLDYPATLPEELPSAGGVDSSPLSSIVSGIYFDLSSSLAELTLVFSDKNAPLVVSIEDKLLLSLPEGHGKERVAISISAYDLTEVISISSGTISATYSLARYAEQALEQNPSDSLRGILLAMYAYADASKAYKQYLEGGESPSYKIVYPASSAHLAEMAEMMRKYIIKKNGTELELVADSADGVNEYEILLGATNRAESAISCPADSFYIGITDKKVVLYGNDGFYSDMAILYFLENILTEKRAATFLTEEAGYVLTKSEENSLGAYLQYTNIVSDTVTYAKETKYSKRYVYSDGTVTTSSTYANNLEGVTLSYTLQQSQGAASDGRYLYLVHTNPSADGAEGADNEDKTHIYKVDPVTMSVVKIGPKISARHANDMAYNPVTGQMLVVWSIGNWVSELDMREVLEDGSPNPNYLGVLSSYRLGGEVSYTTLVPDSENGGYKTTSLAFHALGYDEISDRWVGATSSATPDGYGMVAFTIGEGGIAEIVGIIDTPDLGYTKQGGDCDGRYVYHTQSYPKSDAERDSYIVVCDWDGNHVRTLKIPYPDSGTNTIEIETIMWCNGTLYMAANRGGGLSVARLSINYNVD